MRQDDCHQSEKIASSTLSSTVDTTTLPQPLKSINLGFYSWKLLHNQNSVIQCSLSKRNPYYVLPAGKSLVYKIQTSVPSDKVIATDEMTLDESNLKR